MTHRVLLSKNTATGAASRGFPFPRKLQNSRGEVFYGMHFVPGVAGYPFGVVFVNEKTIREMGPSFAACPVYVEHTDDVPESIDETRVESDGVVVESFFNAADGKHWVKFIVQSERGLKAIRDGYRLSNCYEPQDFGPKGQWNGVDYMREVVRGEYDHLALVRNPRYEESIVLTPDQFKAYNERHVQELSRLANDNKGGVKVALKAVKKTKIENAAIAEMENTVILLEKSGKEMTVLQLANAADEAAMKEKGPCVANMGHMVNYGGKDMTVNDLLTAHKMANDELEVMRAASAKDTDDAADAPGGDADHVMENEDDDGDVMENEDDDGDVMENGSLVGNPSNEGDDEKAKTKNKAKVENSVLANAKADTVRRAADAKEKAKKLRNANRTGGSAPVLRLPADKVQRGKDLFGAG